MAETKIEWTKGDDGMPGRTWNPLRGCSLKSTGCRSCYAMKQAHRFSGKGQPYEGLTRLGPNGPTWTGVVRAVPEKLAEPLGWRKPCRVFVNSMSDLFHEDVPDEFIGQVFAVMAACRKHTFQVLTKRADRMAEYFACRTLGDVYTEVLRSEASEPAYKASPLDEVRNQLKIYDAWEKDDRQTKNPFPKAWPLPNVWLGVSVETQATANERIPYLLRMPAAVRFLSAEPLLGPIDLARACPCGYYCDESVGHIDHPFVTVQGQCNGGGIHWVIIGGESGPGARPMPPAWARSIVQQCAAAGVPVFVKQMGSRWASEVQAQATVLWEEKMNSDAPEWAGPRPEIDRKGGDMGRFPEDLRVREFPRLEAAP